MNLIEDLKPATTPFDMEKLLNNIEKYISERTILPKGADTAITLWIAGTYNINAFRIFPKLTIISPQKRCGKSTLLDLIEAFSSRSIMTSNISPAAIFRLIDAYQPTLIIDEADTFLANSNSDIAGIINSGHAQTRAFVTRCAGENHDPKSFSTWSPMAIASIGGLQPTIMDRSIIIPLRRKTLNESIEDIPHDLKDSAEKVP